MARTYTQLQKEKNFEELNHFEIKVLERYAISDYVVSQADVARDNNITLSCFKRMKEDAIMHGYISRELVEAIRNKATTKSEMRINQSAGKCIFYYEKLIKQREEFLATTIPRSQIKHIAEDVANNPSNSIKYFKNKYNFESNRLVRLILKIAIVENIVSDETMELIIKRSLDACSHQRVKYKVKQVFDEFIKEREKNKSSQ